MLLFHKVCHSSKIYLLIDALKLENGILKDVGSNESDVFACLSTECGDFAQVRNNCFHVDNMKELFQDIHIDSIMTFLRQINLFNKI